MDITKTYRFIPAGNSPEGNSIDLIGIRCDGNIGFTDFQGGKFYPPVTHYLVEDITPFDRYAEAASSETIDQLESQLENLQNQTIQLRDLFAIAALVGEFAANRGTTIEQAVNFSYTIADWMLKARRAGNE
ncbi:hypothetical protein [Endozoicomonas sp. SESOKO1]|uniref:hypothetical protein n=1 Tax=Endozoicomonas sp. SESOKO1 TaxID=2828742 RepID=UPI0021478838|nr:hypothetical protein [Endozoicomonas sp. SESOKO1]